MSNLLEVIVTSDSNNTLWTSCIWDPHTGTNLMTYRGGGTTESRTLTFIGNDYLVGVERTKPILHVWPLNSHQTVQGLRFILPGKASALAISNDGAFCIAGIEEKIYLWQIASGNLLAIINRHYQKITILKFTPDGRYFVSAAEDGMVMVWSLATVSVHPQVELVMQTTAGQCDPIHIFSDHTLPVTDLYVSRTGMQGRLSTVSSDRTCIIYDLTSGKKLLDLVFDVQLSAVTMDVLELNVFIGTSDGNIYQCTLTKPPRSRDCILNSEDDNINLYYSSHTEKVTCLSASLDGVTLLSGSNDEQVILWHIPSKLAIRTIRHKGPVTNAFFTVNYPAIYKQEFSPSVILHSLERTLEKDTNDPIEIEVLMNKEINFWPKYNNVEVEINDESRREIEMQFAKKEMSMKEEIEMLKRINSNLYAFSVQKALNSVPNNNQNSHKKKKNKKKDF